MKLLFRLIIVFVSVSSSAQINENAKSEEPIKSLEGSEMKFKKEIKLALADVKAPPPFVPQKYDPVLENSTDGSYTLVYRGDLASEPQFGSNCSLTLVRQLLKSDKQFKQKEKQFKTAIIQHGPVTLTDSQKWQVSQAEQFSDESKLTLIGLQDSKTKIEMKCKRTNDQFSDSERSGIAYRKGRLNGIILLLRASGVEHMKNSKLFPLPVQDQVMTDDPIPVEPIKAPVK